jgi:hypothetical protein
MPESDTPPNIPQSNVTQLLGAIRQGSDQARHELFRLLHDELHKAAERLMANEDTQHTLQPTALMNEAVVRLIKHGVLERHPTGGTSLRLPFGP